MEIVEGVHYKDLYRSDVFPLPRAYYGSVVNLLSFVLEFVT